MGQSSPISSSQRRGIASPASFGAPIKYVHNILGSIDPLYKLAADLYYKIHATSTTVAKIDIAAFHGADISNDDSHVFTFSQELQLTLSRYQSRRFFSTLTLSAFPPPPPPRMANAYILHGCPISIPFLRPTHPNCRFSFLI